MSGCDQKPLTTGDNQPALVEVSGDINMFNSTEELDAFLKDVSTAQNYGVRGGIIMGAAMKTTAVAESAPSAAGDAVAQDFSQTNVQVQGVDEADFVKNDGRYIYLMQNNMLVIVDALDAKNAKIISQTDLPKNTYASNLFIYGDKVVVLAESNEESFYFRKYDILPLPDYEPLTKVLIYDVSDRKNPKLDNDFKVSGSYFQSRMIDKTVYLVAVKYAGYPIRPPIVYAKSVMSPNIYYFDNGEEQYNYNTIVSIDVNSEDVIDTKTYLLGYSNTLMMSEDNIYIAYQKQSHRCWGFYCRDDQYDRTRFTEVVVPLLQDPLKIDIQNILDSKISEDAQWEKISAKLSEFYNDVQDDQDLQDKYESMFSDIQNALDEYDTKQLLENSKTIIHKIAVDNGRLSYDSKGEVDGRLLNQYSLDEYDGNLRLATTVDLWTNSGRKEYNNVYVLDKNMDIVGKVEGLAQNESIYSTRFMGDKLYMVTFRQIDPFFVIDLSNPKAPKVLGALKIPGYSSYLHPYNENFIIGVGKSTNTNEWGGVTTGGVKLSLFDVSDFEDPKEVDTYDIGMQGTDSPVLYEPKAFLFSASKGIIVLPVSEVTSRSNVQYGYNYAYWDGAYVFKVSESGFELLGKIKHDSRSSTYYTWYDRASVTRSLYMDNNLYTISNKYIKINDLANDLELIKTVNLPDTNNIVPHVAGEIAVSSPAVMVN
jgi:uncharacterized secreted protein with C-terminal beta-propeller domain